MSRQASCAWLVNSAIAPVANESASETPVFFKPSNVHPWTIKSPIKPLMATGWTMILNNGGLRSLVATALALSHSPRPRVSLLHVQEGLPNDDARMEHAHQQAEHFSCRQVIDLDIPRPVASRHDYNDAPDPFEAVPLRRPRLMMLAISQAMELHAERVIWPVQPAGDFAAIARITEQLVLLRHSADLEAARHEKSARENEAAPRFFVPDVETPLVELTDRQIVELGSQLHVPWHLAWSCLIHHDRPCRACNGCRRRLNAFDAAGIVDPLLAVAA